MNPVSEAALSRKTFTDDDVYGGIRGATQQRAA